MERNAASLLRLSSSRDSNLEEELQPQQPGEGGGWGSENGDGRDLSLSESQEHVSSLNITLRTGLGGTGSPHVHTHSHVVDTCPLSLLLRWEFPFRFALEDLWKRLTGL